MMAKRHKAQGDRDRSPSTDLALIKVEGRAAFPYVKLSRQGSARSGTGFSQLEIHSAWAAR